MAEESAKDVLVQAIMAGRSRKYEPPQPTTDRQFAEISQSDYDICLSPAKMLAAMPYGVANQVQLGRELKADRYRSAADEVHWAYEGFTGRDKLALLPPWLWSIVMPDGASDFWRTGYLEAWIPKGDRDYSLPDIGNWLRIYGVRFWAPDINEQPDSQVSAALNPADQDERAQLPKPEAERFCRAILTEWPQATQDWAFEKAQLFFPDHKFARDWFRLILRSIRGHTKRGKKPKTDI